MTTEREVPERFRDLLICKDYKKYLDLTEGRLNQKVCSYMTDDEWILATGEHGIEVWYNQCPEHPDTDDNVKVLFELKGCGSFRLQLTYKARKAK